MRSLRSGNANVKIRAARGIGAPGHPRLLFPELGDLSVDADVYGIYRQAFFARLYPDPPLKGLVRPVQGGLQRRRILGGTLLLRRVRPGLGSVRLLLFWRRLWSLLGHLAGLRSEFGDG